MTCYLKHPDINGVSFVGSTSVGKHIYKTAAAHGKRVQALTEAKNHALVLRDAKLERTARGIILGTSPRRPEGWKITIALFSSIHISPLSEIRYQEAGKETFEERPILAQYKEGDN